MSPKSKINRREVLQLMAAGAAGALLAPGCASPTGDGAAATGQDSAADSPKRVAAPTVPLNAKLSYPFELPALPYDYDALDAAIDTQTMQIHHGKHHQGYTNKLNAALKDHSDLHEMSIFDLLANLDSLPAEIRTAVRNSGGGYLNHALYWPAMSPSGGGAPSGDLAAAIDRDLGGLDAFKEKFATAAKTQFGSGWGWLAADDTGKLHVLQTANQDSPISRGYRPLLGVDVWEHAYYLRYQNRRGDYLTNFMNIVNWEQVGKTLAG